MYIANETDWIDESSEIPFDIFGINQDFIGNWTSGQESFRLDPPNAVLVIDDQKEDTIEIELYNPKYDNDAKKINYDFTLLGNKTTASDFPNDLGKLVLIIDSFPMAVNSQVTDW